jgi:hypothetical protein
LEKRLSVRQLTHFPVVNPAIQTRHRNQKTQTFFGREILKTVKFSGRKLKIIKKVGVKFFRPDFFRFEIWKIQKSSGRKFVRPNFSGQKFRLPEKFWSNLILIGRRPKQPSHCRDYLSRSPPYASPAPSGGGGVCDASRITCAGKLSRERLMKMA